MQRCGVADREGALQRSQLAHAGVVRLTKHELADRRSSRCSRGELTPLGQGGRTVLFEDVAAVEVAVVVEVIVD